ncbi:hypothetical protein MFRU_002g00560 [Monilinia fructicola]|nr:hypothetical protein MFRU_002g00560 [Monilinia fructicola]
MAGARTRAQGASPGGFKTLDDIEKPKRGKGNGKGRGRAKKTKAEPVEPSVESESVEPYTSEAEGNHNTESQNAQSPTSNPSRTNSPESHSPSPTPADYRLESRSTSPPPRNNTTSNDASSDNDAVNKEQNPERSSPLGSNRKRSRVEESSTHQSDDITRGDSEEVQQPSSKRTRFHKVTETNNAGAEVVEADAEAEESTEPVAEKRPRGRPARNRAKATPKPANKIRGRKQDPIVLNESSSDESPETTVSPLLSRSKSASKQPITPSPRTPQNQQEHSSADEEEHKAAPSTTSKTSPNLTFPPPGLQPTTQAEAVKPAPSLAEIGPDPEQRMKAASKHYGFPPIARAVSLSSIKLTPGMGKTARLREMHMQKYFPGRLTSPSKGKEVAKEVTKEVSQNTNDVAQTERKKMTAVASSENLSKSDISSWRQSPSDGLKLTDPYLVAVAKVFTNHKDKSKAMPSIEQITAFLDSFDGQQASYNPNTQMVVRKPLAQEPKTPSRHGFVVPGYESDDDTVMSDEETAQEVEEPKTPEAPASPVQEASPRSSWWNPISTVATMITSPFRKQSAAPAPLPRNKLVPPPFIFKQPPTTPSAAPLKRMSKSDRKRNNRNNIQGRLGATGFQTERRPRHKNVERTPVHRSGLLTPDEVKEIHRAQDEYAAKHQNRGPLIVANRDIHKASREAHRNTFADPVEKVTRPSTPARSGDKRDANGAPRSPRFPQPWNEVLAQDTTDEDDNPRWVRCRNGLYMRSDCTRRQLELGEIVAPNDPRYKDQYRDIDAFPKQDIFKPAGVQNPLNSAQLLEQAHLRQKGDKRIPDERENDYTYVLDQRQKNVLFYPRSPYNMFDIPGHKLTANHIANLEEGLPLLTPRDEFGIAIKKLRYDMTRPLNDTGPANVFEQLHDWDKKQYYKEQADLKAGRILEPKQWTQTPPPKPKPGNATLPGTLEKAPISEAVQQAMNKANKYLPAKSSGLRNVATMSPLQGEQDSGTMVLKKPDHPIFQFDFADEEIGFVCDHSVKLAVADCVGKGLIPITPIPEHIWNEHVDLPECDVERAVAKLFAGVDARIYGSAHNGIVPENNDTIS